MWKEPFKNPGAGTRKVLMAAVRLVDEANEWEGLKEQDEELSRLITCLESALRTYGCYREKTG